MFDAGKIVKRLQKEFKIVPIRNMQLYDKKLICELNAKYREEKQEIIQTWIRYREESVERFRKQWNNRITGIYILLEKARTCEDGGEYLFTALRRVEKWVNESLPEEDRR